MRVFTRLLSRAILALGLAVSAPAAAVAACADLDAITSAQLNGVPVPTVQSGLRNALQDNNSRLRDGFLGSYTRTALVRLCEAVPRAGDAGDIVSTVDLAREYADLTTLMPNWRRALGGPLSTAVLSEIDQYRAGTGRITLPLRLAGTPRMAVAVFENRGDLFPCADAVLTDQPTALLGAQALQGVYGAQTAAQLCGILPVSGTSMEDLVGAFARLGRIETALPGALADLASEDFARRVAENSASYHLRLTGTDAAVVKLIEEFRADRLGVAYGAADPAPASVAISPCELDRSESAITYYSLSQEDVDRLGRPVELAGLLKDFREANPEFDSAEALWQALRDSLEPSLDPCLLDMVRQIVVAAPELAHEFYLDQDRAQNLILNPDVQPVLPVLDGFADSRATSSDELLGGIRAALTTDRGTAVAAEVEQAAEITAAAAEPEQVFYDLPPEGVEIPELPPSVARVVVTGATDDAVAETVGNEQFRKVLAETSFAPATSPELIKSQVRGALRGAAAVETTERVDRLMAGISPVVAESWSLTERLQTLILEHPSLQEAIENPFAPQVAEATKTLVGIEYPNLRLFETALKTAPLPAGWASSDPQVAYMERRLLMAARKTAPQPEVTRVYGPLGAEGCDCIPSRSANAEVYGFYPFWDAPLPKTPAAKEDATDPAGPADAAPAVPEDSGQRRVDFGTVSRIAFYGLELALERSTSGLSLPRVSLRYENQWQAARQAFVNSAHRYRAKADVSIDLRDWKRWSDANIDEAVAAIVAQMTRFHRIERLDWKHLGAALPTIFDAPQPDGVTLIFRDYPGTEIRPPEACRITQLISRVYLAMPDRDAQSINIAVDLDLPWQQNDKWELPLFVELEQLLVKSDPISVASSRRQCDGLPAGTDDAAPPPITAPLDGTYGIKVIDKVLVFVERPTRSAAQMLRYQMEVSPFDGNDLTAALRSVIPVVPPGAHRLISAPGDTSPYSGFKDEVVYFQDNFGGIGFWTAPAVAMAEGDDASQVAAALSVALDNRWSDSSTFLQALQRQKNAVCGFVCPNRGYIGLAAIALLAALAALTWRSFYSGTADRIAFRVLTIGVVWIGNVVLIVLLFLLASCDPVSYTPWIPFALLVTALGLLLIYNFVQRAKNGPMP